MNRSPITKEFSNILQRVGLTSVLLKLVAVPVGLIQAKLLSDVVLSATAGDFNGVLKKGGLIVLLVLAMMIFELISQTVYQKSKSNAIHKCKLRLYQQYLSSPLSLLYRSSAGQAAVIFKDDFDTMTELITEVRPGAISAWITVIAYSLFLCIQSPIAGLILLFVSLLQIVPPLIFKGLYEKYDVADKEIEKQSTNRVLELYNGFSTIKLFDLKEQMLARLKILHDKWGRIANRLQATCRTEEAADKTIENLLTYGTYAIIGLLILRGLVETETGVKAIAISSGLYAAVKSVFATITKFSLAKMAETRMREFWNVQSFDKQMVSPEAGITFSNISCTLEEKTVFSGLDLDLPLTGVTVIQGENGSGKSTLMKLALGMIEGQGGDIQTGGVLPSRLSYDNFPRKIFFLPQEDAIYHLTPSELYQMLLDAEERKTACRLGAEFGLAEDVFERMIPELSGGERKKVFLSLAFAVHPDVLILDEPTNSLDTSSCRVLYDLLRNRAKGTVIITHDEALTSVGTVIYCVQKGGDIVERICEKADL